ncbi:Nucleotidyltransferase [Paraoerskovia marina]|uniref:Nucleotidyltransferase n=1 Tax=Paraoerskovia marina TaxID=545619 RepID=A0A1H1MLA4_9CELL|nr:DUF427 domain-containing protein [Paraoerskovia marina]SDR87518.1 Nucleotidyltransferase [Paraoerskovia marina]
MRAIWNDVVVAESEATVVVEGNHYFPPEAVRWDLLESSSTRTTCPWKGEAHYWSLAGAGPDGVDSVWAYPEPKDAAAEISGHAAFGSGFRVMA